MANISVSVPQNTINVDINTSTVNVAQTTNTIQVSEQARTSNSDIRQAISVSNISGFGNLTYDATSASNGIIQYTGVSTSDIRSQLGNTAPILYNQSTGVFSIDEAAVFAGKTTDDLAEGVVNLYLNGAGTTTDLTEGTNQYFTSGRARAALSYVPGLAGYNSSSGNISIPNSTDLLPEGSTNQYFTNARVDARMTTNLQNLDSGDLVFDITTNATDLLIMDRSGLGSPQANAFLQWDEVNDRFRMIIPGVINGYIPVDTDDLFEGTTNLYLNGSGTTDDLAEGSANLWYTDARSRLALSGANGISYSNVTGVIELSDSELISGVEAGNGLTGGGNTGNVTLNVGSGYGITVNADNIEFANSVLDTLQTHVTTTANVQGNYVIAIEELQGNLNSEVATITKLTAKNIVADINDLGTVSGNLAIDCNSGTTVLANIDGNVTGISFSNLDAGGTVSIVFQQDAVGFRTLDTTTHAGNWANWQFVGNDTELTTGPNTEDVLTVMYDGTNYLASLVRFEAESEISISGNITAGGMTINGEATVTGNLEVGGNINYVYAEDLLITDNSITMNYGNAAARDAHIYVDRSGSALNNAHIRWNETSSQWEIYDGTSTYIIPRSTSDLAEGTNLYYTTARFDTDFATKDTDDLAQGSTNLYFTDTNANTWFTTQTTDNLTEGSTNLYYTDSRSRAALSVTTLTPSGNGALSYSNTTGVFSFTPADVPDNTDELPEGSTNLYYTTDRANAAIANYDGNISTTGNITGGYILAGNDAGGDGIFIGDINGAIQQEVTNDSGVILARGKAVYLTGGVQGDTPNVSLADNSNVSLMPVIGIVKNQIAIGAKGEIVTSGQLNIGTHGFAQGSDLFVNGTGDLQVTPPTGEGNLVQKIGKVVSSNQIIVQGAFRTNATPNLDDGNIFLGNTNNQAESASFTTSVRGNISVATDLTYDQANGIIGLSNVLTGVDTIRTDNNSEFKENAAGDFVITKTFASVPTSAETANIQGDGFAIYTGNDGSFNNNFNFGSWLQYSGTDDLQGTAIKGNVTAGSNQITVTDTRTGFLRFNNPFDGSPTMSKITEYMAWENGGAEQNSYPFPQGAYVTAVDSGNNIVTMSEVAKVTTTFDHVTQGGGFMNAIVDTNVGQVYAFLTQLDTGGGSPSIIFVQQVMVPDNYGYPDTGPVLADFNQASFSDTANLSLASLSNYMKGRTALTPDFTAIKAKDGIAIGANASLSTRAEGDFVNSFGLNILWDGQAKSTEGNPNMINQVLVKHYTDDSYQSTTQGLSIGGPRLLFVGANGNSSQIYSETYPRASQEIGRIGWWGTHKENAIPVSQNPPAFISVQAHDDWDKPGHIGTGPAGNADVFMTGTANAATNASDLFMSYYDGELTLASGKPNSQAPITLAPAQQPSNNLAAGAAYGNPAGIYAQKMTWANINYANTTASTGAQFAVTNNEDVSGNDGDYVIGLMRNNNDFAASVSATSQFLSPIGSNATFLQINQFGGTFTPADAFHFDASFSSPLTGLSDGDAVTIQNATGSHGTYFNGNTYYVKYNATLEGAGFPGWYLLYTNPGLTTPVNSGESTAVAGGQFDYTVALGIEKSHWKFTLPSGSNSMIISEDDVTHSTFYENGNLDVVGDLTAGGRITAGANLDVTTGDVNVSSGNLIVSSGDLTVSGTISGSVSLQKFNETVVALGSQSGDISSSLDADNGTIYTVTATGGITINSIANAVAGTSMTIIVTQDVSGNHTLTSSMKFAGGEKTLSIPGNSIDIISVFYDGSTYYASLTTGYA